MARTKQSILSDAIEEVLVSSENYNKENRVQGNNSQGTSLIVLQLKKRRGIKSDELLPKIRTLYEYVSYLITSLQPCSGL